MTVVLENLSTLGKQGENMTTFQQSDILFKSCTCLLSHDKRVSNQVICMLTPTNAGETWRECPPVTWRMSWDWEALVVDHGVLWNLGTLLGSYPWRHCGSLKQKMIGFDVWRLEREVDDHAAIRTQFLCLGTVDHTLIRSPEGLRVAF